MTQNPFDALGGGGFDMNALLQQAQQMQEQLQEAQHKNDAKAAAAQAPLINFHGGGHVNHSLFWENLAPANQGGGEPPSGALAKAIDESFGSLGEFQSKMNAALAGIQGSGWAWLVKDKQTGNIGIKTYAVSSSL